MMHRLFAAALLFLSGAASSGFMYYEQPDPAPYLKTITPIPACDYTISSDAGWAQINNPAYRVFCVTPGSTVSAGTIAITADGTSEAPRWIRYLDPTGEVADSTHPYHMPDAKRARIPNLGFNGADYWIVDRMYIYEPTTYPIWLVGSDHNVFSRIFADWCPANVFLIAKGSDYNTLQHNIVSRSRAYTGDGIAIALNVWNKNSGQLLPADYEGTDSQIAVTNNVIVSNECFDVIDCVHIVGVNPTLSYYPQITEENYEGTVVYNNDFYATTAANYDCTGNLDPAGLCSKLENGFDLKSLSTNASNPVIVAHNRVWGWKESDPIAKPNGSWGDAFLNHWNGANLRFEGNVVWGSHRLFSNSNIITNLTVSGNLFAELLPTSYRTTATYGINNLYTGAATGSTITGNVLSDLDGAEADALYLLGSAYSFTDNVMITATGSGGTFSGTASGNKYYASTVPAWDTSPAVNEASVVGSGYENDFCTTIKRLTAPETRCFANALADALVNTTITPPSNFQPID